MRQAGGPEVLGVEARDVPTPEATEVLIRVRACGVCGHDQADRAGLTRVSMPCVLGHELAGEVVEVGRSVRAFRKGDLVASKQFMTCGSCLACRSGQELDCPKRRFVYGGCAEYVTISDDALLLVPEGVDPVGASIVACAIGTCFQALVSIGKMLPGETVAVTGAGGGLGIHGIQLVRALGGEPIAITSSPEKTELLLQLGATAVVVGREKGFFEEILTLTKGRGVDMVLDSVGHPLGFNECLRALRPRGRYVLTGQLYRERISLYPFFVFSRETVITGSASTLMSSFMAAMELVRTKKVVPIVGATLPLSEAAKAHSLMDNRGVTGRVVLVA